MMTWDCGLVTSSYFKGFENEYFDAMFLPQAPGNCSNWSETARDLVRVLRKNKMFVSTEITLGGPTFQAAINSDQHNSAGMEIIMMNDRGILAGELYNSPEELLEVFKGMSKTPRVFRFCDAILFYGRNPC